jgi:Uma2 family endonuclease
LTPELYLDPQLGDTMVQGEWHDLICREITDILAAHFKPQPDVLVVHDVKHKLLPRRPAPAPDVSVIRGIRHRRKRSSFNVAKEGFRPCLVVEVVSPMNAEVRQTDLVGKVALYRDAGIPEYIIVDSPGKGLESPFELLGYRLDAGGRYQPMEPDAAGRFLSTTTGIWFQVSPDGQRVFLFEQSTGRRLLNLSEEMDLRKAAEQENRFEAKARRAAEAAREAAEEKAAREVAAREAAEEKAARAEADLARLRAEIERLRRDG